MLNRSEIEELKLVNSLPAKNGLCLNIAIDPGSTETRGICYSRDSDLENLPKEDVETSLVYCGEYGQDYSDIAMLNPTIYDSLEMHFMRNGEPFFSCLKGTLATEMGANDKVYSSQSKVDQQITLANINSFIAMEMLKFTINSGYRIPESTVVGIRLTLAMPPEDTSKGRVEAVKESISGKYQAVFSRLGVQFEYEIKKDDIEIMSECNAVAMYYGMTSDEEDENTLVFEGGGRSSSIAVILNGRLVMKLNVNDNDICGNRLKEELNSVISERLKRKKLSDMAIESALTKGYFKIGINYIDVAEEVKIAKSNFSHKCVQFIMQAIDNTGMSCEDFQKIVFDGRLMNEVTDESNKVIIPSLADYITEEFSAMNNMQITQERVNCIYPIPAGLSMYRIGLE